MFILSAAGLYGESQTMSDSSRLDFLICDLAIEHQNRFVDYAPLKSWCSPVLRLHFVSCSMY